LQKGIGMEFIENNFSGWHICIYGAQKSLVCLVQPVSEHESCGIENELEFINKSVGAVPYTFVTVGISDWNSELSPWSAPAVFGKESFGDGAAQTLSVITEQIIPNVARVMNFDADVKFILGGYSLAGLFSLWSGYQTEMFYGTAAASPSVWFPNWDNFIQKNKILAKRVYLSLGDKEAKTRNTIMSHVDERIRLQNEILQKDLGENCTLKWNKGNHFQDADLRTAAAFTWIMQSF
jgi:predicted alpha/beta superfamily hydrolase